MKFIAGLIGLLLLIPLGLVIVALLVISLVGGYAALVISVAWPLVLAVLIVILVFKIINRFTR